IVVPPNAVVDAVKQCIEAEIKTAVVITAGFGEVRTKDRQEENKKLIKIAEKELIFVGPNSLGIYTSKDESSPLFLGMGLISLRPGNLAIISQSGTIGTLLSNMIKRVRYFVSSGNEASLTLEDYLEFFAQDDKTEAIALFVEGLRAGNRFKNLCSEITETKPVIMLKGGITKAGARAASSHTSSISGSIDIYKSVFKQTGVIYADNIMEFLYLVKGALYLLPFPINDPLRIGILSAGGGFGVILSDLCEKQGLDVVDLNKHPKGPRLIDEISKYLPFYWSRGNPIDLVATIDFNLLPKVLKIVLKYNIFDIVITQTSVVYDEMVNAFHPVNERGKKMKEMMAPILQGMANEISKKEINSCLKFPDKKIIFISPIPVFTNPAFDRYDENKILIFGGNPEICTIVLRKLHEYQKYVDRKIKHRVND
ncbi:MAG: hypothetical protein HWN67_06655, partial [Candidatus Helarchaeota archaeon]|nr:hypothetical protein [Candidatus Helarchaeota archaeon]